MTFGTFQSSQPTFVENAVSSFFFNKSLQQQGAEYRAGEYADDLRRDLRMIGGAMIATQERAIRRYDTQATATRAAIEAQTREVARGRDEAAGHARLLQATIAESTQTLRREIEGTNAAIEKVGSLLSGQLTHVAWLLAEQNHTLSGIFRVLRESRSNECRQLVEQGERNLHAGFFAEAEDRFKLALTFDNTDYTVHQNLGLVYVHLARLDEAITHFRKAMAFPLKDPHRKDSEAFFIAHAATHAARVAYAQNDYATAATYFRQALDAQPTNAKNWYDLAIVSAQQGHARAAEEALAHAFFHAPALVGQALSDPELEPIQGEIERLVVAETERARLEAEAFGRTLRALHARAAAIARETGVAIPLVADPEAIVRHALERGTYLAAREASTSLELEHTRARSLIRTAIKKALERIAHAGGADAARVVELERVFAEMATCSIRRGA